MKNRFAFIVQHKYRKILDKCKKYSVTSRTVFIGTYLQGTLSEVLQIIPRRSKKEHKKIGNDSNKNTPLRHIEKHNKAYRKKYKPYILKYKALISKYMPCIFRVYKYLKKNVF